MQCRHIVLQMSCISVPCIHLLRLIGPYLLLHPREQLRCIVMSTSVCLFACVCLSPHVGPTRPKIFPSLSIYFLIFCFFTFSFFLFSFALPIVDLFRPSLPFLPESPTPFPGRTSEMIEPGFSLFRSFCVICIA